MVRVCDAIMGTGKTSAAITYLNEHKDGKFIFITPYLAEATRIKDNCPDLHFVEPSKNFEEYNWRKIQHTAALVKEGRNITTTHQAFRGYTPELLQSVRENGYTLIVDESVDVLEKFDVHPHDIQMVVDAGYIEDHDGIYSVVKKDYEGRAMKDLFRMLESRELVRVKDRKDNKFFYWALPPELITSFQEVIILTYLFNGQSLHHLLQIYDIPYEYIGVHKDEDGVYRFGDYPGYIPEYVHSLKEKIHILDAQKINEIGDDFYALSKNWYESGKGNTEQLKDNLYNVFRHLMKDIPSDERLWGTFKGVALNQVKGKGYTKRFLTFNAKATNDYRKCIGLAYVVNVFMNGAEKQFYTMHGIKVDENLYALSIAVQWIWRSAIRDGNEVWIYIPSRRMRKLVQDWIDSFDNGTSSKEGGEANA